MKIKIEHPQNGTTEHELALEEDVRLPGAEKNFGVWNSYEHNLHIFRVDQRGRWYVQDLHLNQPTTIGDCVITATE